MPDPILPSRGGLYERKPDGSIEPLPVPLPPPGDQPPDEPDPEE